MNMIKQMPSLSLCKALCAILFLSFVLSSLSAQTDSSLIASPPDTFDTAITPDIYATKIDTLGTVFGPQTLPPPSFKKRISKTLDAIQEELPELYEEDKKMRLRLKFPWRNDIVLPFPKGVLPAPRPPPFDPVVAWQRSLMIPTWGQIYNRRYWKVPIFLAGYGGAIWWANFNQQQYVLYGNAYTCKVNSTSDNPCDPGEQFSTLDAQGIRTRRNSFRQNRDYAMIGVIGWHLISVAEAFVDAHLRGFDVSDDLSLFQIKPMIEPISLSNGAVGAGLGLRVVW